MTATLKPESTDEFDDVLRRHWYHGGRIVEYEVLKVNRTLIQTWGQIVLDTVTTWQAGVPYRAIHNLMAQQVGLAYLAMTKFDIVQPGILAEISQAVLQTLGERDALPGNIAICFSTSASGYLANVNSALKIRQTQLDVHFRTFFDTDSAVAWLQSGE